MNNNMGKKKSVLGIVEGIVIAILILIIGCILALYVMFSDTSATPKVGGFVFYHTRAVNMEPEIPVNSAIIGKTSEIDNIKVGSVIICRIGENSVVSRVVQLNNNNGEMSYVTKWDTAAANDTFEVTRDNVIGKAIWTSRSLGLLLDFSTSTFGIMMIIIIPSFVIIVFQIIKIINVKKMEEDALSIDDLSEMMDDMDDRFTTPKPVSVPEPAPEKTVRTELPLDKLEPVSFDKPADKDVQTVLNVDRNGKAELKPVSIEETPLFKFENNDIPRRNNPFENNSEAQADAGDVPSEESAPVSFMSNVLPAKIENTVAAAEKPSEKPAEKPAEKPVEKVEPAAEEKPEVKADVSIPEKAVVPKERIAPPRKKNTKKTISELMSIIDAEESKLK